ncbi:hypothetical protein Taro_007587 [Colocasia esculenta]|uniref:Uncharacterized protein n=1 Tax=Colocasia esculenta TaxID=4460 RepID=A0A843TYL7_COLES|nr:hypothetical protein [Colocasia esculenta]
MKSPPLGLSSWSSNLLARARAGHESLREPVLGFIRIRGSTEPRRVQTPEVTMQLACTATVSTTLGSLHDCTSQFLNVSMANIEYQEIDESTRRIDEIAE